MPIDLFPNIRMCGVLAVATYQWPNHEPLTVCEEHLEEVKGWARIHGFELQYQKAAKPGTRCRQMVRVDKRGPLH